MDKFIVSARKYRPAAFSDVVGQASISATLKNSILNQHLGHAYLFSGPRGVGKTTCARIFARTINCMEITPEGEACNQCESCRSFNENRSFSIHELDAASNNSVEDIRNLSDQVRIPPQIGRYSIYIIDEVHMLSQQAFNAFLKTLEEPPAHAVFILATTEKHKIIPTILSRCQIFDFNRIRVEDTVDYLLSIAGKEGITCEEDALTVIAQKADGAMRDALSIFDQVVSFSGEKLSYQNVIANLNILDYEYYFRLTAFAMEGDAPSMLLLFNEVLAKGFDARNFMNGYAGHLRDLMVCKDPATVELMEVGAGFREKYLSQSRQLSLPFLYDALEICNQADIQFRASRNQRLTIELALVRLAKLIEAQKKKIITEPAPEKANAEPAPERKATEPSPKEARAVQMKAEESHAAPEASPSSQNAHDNGSGRTIRKPVISIKASLSNSGQEVKEDAAPVQEQDAAGMASAKPVEASPESILEAWAAYAISVEKTKPRVSSTLQVNKPEWGPGGILTLRLNSEAQRDNFHKNIRPELTDFIRKRTGADRIEIQTEVFVQEQNGRKLYTDQDKLLFLIQKNPEMEKLKSHFNLDFDN